MNRVRTLVYCFSAGLILFGVTVCGPAPQTQAVGVNGEAAPAVFEPRQIWEITWKGPEGVEHIQARSVSVSNNYVWYQDLETGKVGYVVSLEVKIVQKK